MSLRAAALATPGSAALALLAVRGSAILHGEGRTAFAVLASTGVAALLALLVARRGRRGERAAPVSAEAEAMVQLSTAMGDAALACDANGRVLRANPLAASLASGGPEALAARGISALGDDVAVLSRGADRGAARGRVAIPTLSGLVEGRAAVAPVPGKARLHVVVIRVERAPAAQGAPIEIGDDDIVPDGAGVEPGRAELAGGEAALAAELRGPLASAGAAAALLRLALPRGHADGHRYLDRLERALRDAEGRAAALALPLAGSVARPVDLDALVSDAIAATAWPAGLRVGRAPGSAWALADPRPLRDALRHLLRAAASAMPAGGDLRVRAGARGDAAFVEVAHTGVASDGEGEIALAARLVRAMGGKVEGARAARGGATVRLELPRAPGRAAPAAAADPPDRSAP